jgi:hypothetical protein
MPKVMIKEQRKFHGRLLLNSINQSAKDAVVLRGQHIVLAGAAWLRLRSMNLMTSKLLE